MLNVLVALRIWANNFKNKKITIKCDNMSAVNVLRNGKTNDTLLAAIARNVQMQAAKYNVFFNVIHIQGKHNTAADLLSHWQQQLDVNKLKVFISSPIWVNVSSDILNIDWDI